MSSSYLDKVDRWSSFCGKRGWYRLSRAIAVLFIEPQSFLWMITLYVLGYFRPFQYFGLNPLRIPDSMREKPALLLLHGNVHNQSAWLHLSHYMRKMGAASLFTVNLPHGDVTEKDMDVIRKKIGEIQRLYQESNSDAKIILLGHSRGGEVAYHFLAKKEEAIHSIITMGFPVSAIYQDLVEEELKSKIFELQGNLDILVKERSLGPNYHTLPTGHTGFLFSKEAFQKITLWIEETIKEPIHK